MSNEFPNTNAQWCEVIIETLRRKGLRHAVVCMGSRSSPLALGFAAREGIESYPVLDERSAGFFALGLAKRSKRPVALICTSGTAAANFFPAIIEASESHAPLIVLTADRPHELRQCRAGQTIDQVKLYGGYAKHFTEFALPENSLSLLRYVRQRTASLFDSSLLPLRGPVHANMPFREPLSSEFEMGFSPVLENVEDFCSKIDSANDLAALESGSLDLKSFCNCERGLILVGAVDPEDEERWILNVSKLAITVNWPILADALNPVRGTASRFPNLICSYDLIARGAVAQEVLKPEKVLVIGEFPISKQLKNWIQSIEPEILILSSFGEEGDPTHSKSVSWQLDFSHSTCSVEARVGSAFLEKWLAAERLCSVSLKKRLEDDAKVFEGAVSSTLADELVDSELFVSNSMPPRDLEFFRFPNDNGLRVWFSRGANGIDGIVSTALGVAEVAGHAYLLTGDLAFLHDSNGLLLGGKVSAGLTIVLINNNGGGIFEMLPVAKFDPPFEEYFAAPQSVDIGRLCGAHGIEHKPIPDLTVLRHALQTRSEGVIRVLELTTDRKLDTEKRKKWFAEISEELEPLFAY